MLVCLQVRAEAGMRQAFVQTFKVMKHVSRGHKSRWQVVRKALENFRNDPRRMDNLTKRINAFVKRSFKRMGQVSE